MGVDMSMLKFGKPKPKPGKKRRRPSKYGFVGRKRNNGQTQSK